MSDQIQPDMSLLGMLFGVSTQEEWDDDLSNHHRKQAEAFATPTAEATEARIADFTRELATADVASIENETSAVGHRSQLHKGGFIAALKSTFDMSNFDVFDALTCTVRDARNNNDTYQTLQRIRREQPAAYATMMAWMAWSAGVEDRGPFGNDWGE